MNPLTLLVLALIAYALWTTNRSVQRCTTEREKTLAIRGIATFWLLGFIFIAALIVLPNRVRVLMLLPGFFLAVALGKAWRNSRERLRREEQHRVDFEKMKRAK